VVSAKLSRVDGMTSLLKRKEVIPMNNTEYYSFRIRLEKLKQKTWQLVVIARLILLLILVINHYL
jgi:hypothetical protein